MSRYTVLIKNRFLNEAEKAVARIKTFEDKENEYGIEAKFLAEATAEAINDLIDNDIYFADVEVEETDEN